MQFDLPMAPTINEIVDNRPEPAERRDFSFSTGSDRFHVGDIVRFFFGSVIRSGGVTTSFRRGLTRIYHIESADHTWYRGIIEANIISKLEPQ
ncbi:hypothetical protein [Duncaniella muris]|uniref:hypothetical protein n=1 Tax=Duncaniella muris TaxID=2094150 RepID=UPI003F7406B5